MYIYTYIHIYAYAYVHIYIYMYIYMYMCVCVCVCVCHTSARPTCVSDVHEKVLQEFDKYSRTGASSSRCIGRPPHTATHYNNMQH